MWSDCVEGECVLVEMSGRWYVGVVLARTHLTARLSPAVCGHDLGDYGMFLCGEVSESTELTPLPRGVELNLAVAESVQAYPREYLARVNRRTHEPLPRRAPQ